jgi:hypothetical protein
MGSVMQAWDLSCFSFTKNENGELPGKLNRGVSGQTPFTSLFTRNGGKSQETSFQRYWSTWQAPLAKSLHAVVDNGKKKEGKLQGRFALDYFE